MVRTQIQLTPLQSARLKKLALHRRQSVAQVIRTAVENELRAEQTTSREELVRRALEAIGSFDSGSNDVPTRHDDHFADSILQ